MGFLIGDDEIDVLWRWALYASRHSWRRHRFAGQWARTARAAVDELIWHVDPVGECRRRLEVARMLLKEDWEVARRDAETEIELARAAHREQLQGAAIEIIGEIADLESQS